ncbi:hypothetical protein Bra3105_06830 [Brachybacterium halotolerans subsp. kimchii]|uniref:hypothetical protein n=1 Tax=Brachybacterium halotolerans TaxID=2795215 RepID=UPI001E603C59|nr:hypothetical protein [Brachybacterium halotolerans]UEJ84021.1 hypothetical protein Bra3105_06830 [Brachybacterium halotolerans subsp. kimchii]
MTCEAWTAIGAFFVALGTIGMGVAATKPAASKAKKRTSSAEDDHQEIDAGAEVTTISPEVTPEPRPESQGGRGWRDWVNLAGTGLSILGAVILALAALCVLTRQ